MVSTGPAEEALASFSSQPYSWVRHLTPGRHTGLSLEALLVILKCPPPLHSGAHMPPARLFVLDAGGQPGSGGPARAVPYNKSCSLTHCWEKPAHLSSYTNMSDVGYPMGRAAGGRAGAETE